MLAFIKIYKTGGNTISALLRSQFGINHCDVQPWSTWSGQHMEHAFQASDLHKVRRLLPNLQSIAGHRVYPWSELEQEETDIKYFTLLREPISRCISFYQYTTTIAQKQGISPLPFVDWIHKENHHNQQTYMLSGSYDHINAIDMIQRKRIFVGLTNRFDESVVLLNDFADTQLSVRYQARNVTPSNEIASKLKKDPAALKLLSEANQEDIRLFEYAVNELFPQTIAQFGGKQVLDERVAQLKSSSAKPNEYRLMTNRIFRNSVYKPALMLYRMFPHKPIAASVSNTASGKQVF